MQSPCVEGSVFISEKEQKMNPEKTLTGRTPERVCFSYSFGRLLAVFLSLFLLLPAIMPVFAESNEPTRQINLVYDDSGSMIGRWNREKKEYEYYDTWCQAKYALEVFAGLLGQKDKLNVYYMSGYSDAGLKLDGSRGAGHNVAEVHKKVTRDGDTPFGAVTTAMNKLKGSKADEKWLVILTDGTFEKKNAEGKTVKDPVTTERLRELKKDDPDIRIMYLAMGPEATDLQADEANGIYTSKAKTSSNILQELTNIGTRVFNKPSYDVLSGNKMSFDVPMKELIVFAQGANVEINGISSGGNTINPSGEPVVVSNTKKENASSSLKDHGFKPELMKVADLKGKIAVFNDVPEGNYTIDLSGADAVNVYYIPAISVRVGLESVEDTKKDDEEEDTSLNGKHLKAGDYTLVYELVKGEDGTGEVIEKSDLLGDVTYETHIINPGVSPDKTDYKSGDKITISEGDLQIDVTAHYLKHYSVSCRATSDYIYDNREVAFKTVGENAHNLDAKGFQEDDQPTKVAVTLNGNPPTDEQWAQMELPELKIKRGYKPKLGAFRVEKSDEKGIFNVWPTAPEKGPSGVPYDGDAPVKVSYDVLHGEETWQGSSEIGLPIVDTRCWACKHIRWIIIAIIALITAAIIIGYLPGVKRRLPKGLKRNPLVKGTHPYNDPQNGVGKFSKDTWKSFVPYITETGSVRIANRVFHLKASKTMGRIRLNNPDIMDRYNIKIGNKRKKDFKGKVEFGPATQIVISDEDEFGEGWTYTCRLNVDNRDKKKSRKR